MRLPNRAPPVSPRRRRRCAGRPGVLGLRVLRAGRLRSQDPSREDDERFRLHADNARDLVYRVRFHPTPGFEYVSPSSTAMTGYSSGGALRRPGPRSQAGPPGRQTSAGELGAFFGRAARAALVPQGRRSDLDRAAQQADLRQGRERHRHRRHRAGHYRAQAGRGGAQTERGAVPPARGEDQRSRLPARARRTLPLHQPLVPASAGLRAGRPARHGPLRTLSSRGSRTHPLRSPREGARRTGSRLGNLPHTQRVRRLHLVRDPHGADTRRKR